MLKSIILPLTLPEGEKPVLCHMALMLHTCDIKKVVFCCFDVHTWFSLNIIIPSFLLQLSWLTSLSLPLTSSLYLSCKYSLSVHVHWLMYCIRHHYVTVVFKSWNIILVSHHIPRTEICQIFTLSHKSYVKW